MIHASFATDEIINSLCENSLRRKLSIYFNKTRPLLNSYSKRRLASDWAGDLDDRKSTSGYIFQLSGAAISWTSKKQACVALSTAEAEYIALASAAQEAVWVRQLLTDLRSDPEEATRIYEDNQAAICLAKNPQFYGRTKHIRIKYHFIREQVENGNVELSFNRAEEMVADVLPKGLGEQLRKLRKMSGLDEMPSCSTCQ